MFSLHSFSFLRINSTSFDGIYTAGKILHIKRLSWLTESQHSSSSIMYTRGHKYNFHSRAILSNQTAYSHTTSLPEDNLNVLWFAWASNYNWGEPEWAPHWSWQWPPMWICIYVYMYYWQCPLMHGPRGSNTLTMVCPYMVRPWGVMYDPAVALSGPPESHVDYYSVCLNDGWCACATRS